MVAEPAPGVPLRALRQASIFCLGLPLGVLIAVAWLADLLAPGQAWLAVPAFAAASVAVAGAGTGLQARWLQ